MSSGAKNELLDRRGRRSPHRCQRSNRMPPRLRPAHLTDDDDDAYVTHASQALYTLHTQPAADERKDSEDDNQEEKRGAEWKRADRQDERRWQHVHHHAHVRRHSSEKTTRSSRQHPSPLSDSSSSLSARLTASTSLASSTGSSRSPHSSPSFAITSSLDRAYTARFRHLSSSLLSFLSSLPSDPSLPVLLRSPLTASYFSDRLRELLVAAMEEEREMAVKAAWEAKAIEEHKRQQAQQDNERLTKERAEDATGWEEERATLHRQLQQCEQALRAERHSNEQWEAQRQLLEQRIKDEEQQREAAEADCQRLEDALQQIQQKLKQQQQTLVEAQQQAEQTAAQLTQLQHIHTAITQHNTQLSSQLAAQQVQQQHDVKELTAELNQRKLALLHKENEWRARQEQLVAEGRSEAERLEKAVKECKKKYSEVALRVKAMREEKDTSEQRERQEADSRAKEKAAMGAEVERLKAALQEQRDRMHERIVRMKEMTVREWKEREAALQCFIQEERGKAEELLAWITHSSDQMAAMKQRLLSEREGKVNADSEWQTERQRWEQTTKQCEEQLKAAEQAITAQQQQSLTQSQQLVADIDKHHLQLDDASHRANRAQQQVAELQADLRRSELEVAQQKEETKEMMMHARVELDRRQKDRDTIEARMRQLQPQLLHTTRRLSQLSATLPSLLATVRQVRQQQSQLSMVWRLECQSMAVGWDSVRGLVVLWKERRREERGERQRLDEEAAVCRRNTTLLLDALSSLFPIPLPLQRQLLSAVSSTAFIASLQALNAQLSSLTTSVREEREKFQCEADLRGEGERARLAQSQSWLQQRERQLQSVLADSANELVQQEWAKSARRLSEVEQVCGRWLSTEDDSSSRQLWHERLSIMLTIMRGSGSGGIAVDALSAPSESGGSEVYGATGVDSMSAVLADMRRTWEVRVQQMQAGVQ